MNFLTKYLASKSGKFICDAPFSQVYIYPDGRVYLCPDCYLTPSAAIGNLNKNSFDEIWNSVTAQFIRREALRGIYHYCSTTYCLSDTNFHAKTIPDKNIKYTCIQKKYPKMVCIGADSECNAACIMCRKELSRMSDEELKESNSKIEKLYIPILKDAEFLTLSTTADPFGSRNTRLLLKTAANTYPKLKFNILTNGILCDEFNCKELGIENRLNKIMFSIHASNRNTYNDIVKNGNWDKVCKNIEWAEEQRDKNKINTLYLAFVVSSKNYYDIPDFIEFAKNHKIKALFWLCRDWGDNLSNSGEQLEVWDMRHPKFSEYCNIINNIDFNNEFAAFSPEIMNIKRRRI